MITSRFEFNIYFQWDLKKCTPRGILLIGKEDHCAGYGYGLKFNKETPIAISFFRDTPPCGAKGFFICILGLELFAYKWNDGITKTPPIKLVTTPSNEFRGGEIMDYKSTNVD